MDKIIRKQNPHLTRQAIQSLDSDAPCFFPGTSNHVLPSQPAQIESWLHQQPGLIAKVYQDQQAINQLITMMSCDYQHRVASLTLIIIHKQVAENDLQLAITEAMTEAREKQCMQRLQLLVTANQKKLIHALITLGFVKESTYGESYWYKNDWIDTKVYAKLW